MRQWGKIFSPLIDTWGASWGTNSPNTPIREMSFLGGGGLMASGGSSPAKEEPLSCQVHTGRNMRTRIFTKSYRATPCLSSDKLQPAACQTPHK